MSFQFEGNKEGKTNRPLVCVQGLGFVGLAMATVIANACDNDKILLYNVVGVDLPTNKNNIDIINKGELPFKTEDASFLDELRRAVLINKNFFTTSDMSFYSQADIVVVDVPLHIEKRSKNDYSKYSLSKKPFEQAIDSLGKKIKPECLVLIETTVPPGFCSKVVRPILEKNFESRNIVSSPIIAYSYERVMPGKEYLSSIRNYYRSFSGIDEKSTQKVKYFLESIINSKDYPLRREQETEACEFAKILENSYRAVNIAFIYEWTLLAENAGINLFSVIEGIKNRKTHNNIMEPGFGVGGYCLTKDSLLALWSADNFYNSVYGLPFSKRALEVNDKMPLHTIDLILQEMKVKNKKVAIMGISYRQDVGDTRFSPSELFYKELIKLKAICFVHDPYVEYWPECHEAPFIAFDHSLKDVDIIVFTVRHRCYSEATKEYLLEISKEGTLFVDAFNILDDEKISFLLKNNRNVIGVGKGHIKRIKETIKCQKY
jgi:UDP-N-acetyl-D-glucosamine dehydrogenase